jgi:hypothetical protein
MEAPRNQVGSLGSEPGMIMSMIPRTSSPSSDGDDEIIFTPGSTPPASPSCATTVVDDLVVPSQPIDCVSLPAGNSSTTGPSTPGTKGFYSSNTDQFNSTKSVGHGIPIAAATVNKSDRLNSDRCFGISKFLPYATLAKYQTMSTQSRLRSLRRMQFSSGERRKVLLRVEPPSNSFSLEKSQAPFTERMETSGDKRTLHTLPASVEVHGSSPTTHVFDGKSVEALGCEKRKPGLSGLSRYSRIYMSSTRKTDRNLPDKANRMQGVSSLYDDPTKQDASTKSTAIENDYSKLLAKVQREMNGIRRLCLTRPDVDFVQLHSDYHAVETDIKLAMSSNNLAVDAGAQSGSKIDSFRVRLGELRSMALELVEFPPLPKQSVTTISALPSQVREYISRLKNLADEATRSAATWPNQQGYRHVAAIVMSEIEEIKAMSQIDAKDTLERCRGMQKHYANQLSIQKAATTRFRTTGRGDNVSPGPRVQVYHNRTILNKETHHEPCSRSEVNRRRVGECGNMEIENAEEHCQTLEAKRVELENALAHLETKFARQAVILKSLGYFGISDESAIILEPTELAVENQVLKSELAKLETLLRRRTDFAERLKDALLEMSDAKIKLETQVEAHGEQMLEANRKSMGQAMEIGAPKVDKTNLECQVKEERTAIGVFRDTGKGGVDRIPFPILGEGEKLPSQDQIFDQRLLDIKKSKKQIESLEALSEMISATADAMRSETREKAGRAEKYDREQENRISKLEKQTKGSQTSKDKELATRSEEIAKPKTSKFNSVPMSSTRMGWLDGAEAERLRVKDRVTDLEGRLSRMTVDLLRGREQMSAEKRARHETSQKLNGRLGHLQRVVAIKEECEKLRAKINELEELVALEKRKTQSCSCTTDSKPVNDNENLVRLVS